MGMRHGIMEQNAGFACGCRLTGSHLLEVAAHRVGKVNAVLHLEASQPITLRAGLLAIQSSHGSRYEPACRLHC